MNITINNNIENGLYTNKESQAANAAFADFMSGRLRKQAINYITGVFYDRPEAIHDIRERTDILLSDETLQKFYYELCLEEIEISGMLRRERRLECLIDSVLDRGVFENYRQLIEEELDAVLAQEELADADAAKFCVDASLKIAKHVFG